MSVRNLIAVVGPTAVGKTSLAIRLAEHYKTEIVSADARQVYRELGIGTAKPTEDELKRIRHHFINHKSIKEDYTAGTFGQEARAVMDQLFASHKQVVLCGGSGLYIKAVLEGFDNLPQVDPEIRHGIMEDFDTRGLSWLQQEVQKNDPDYFETVDRQNPQRLMRALEIILGTGQTFSGFHKKEKIDLPYNVVKIGLYMEREKLYKAIDRRMDVMIENGLFEEAETFFTVRHLNALQTVGYQEAFGLFEGLHNKEEAVRLMKRNSRRYAKRQLTWFRKDKEIQWYHPEDFEQILKMLNEKLDN